jgi:hypothetical protein
MGRLVHLYNTIQQPIFYLICDNIITSYIPNSLGTFFKTYVFDRMANDEGWLEPRGHIGWNQSLHITCSFRSSFRLPFDSEWN